MIKVPQKNRVLQVEMGANLMRSLLDAQIPVASSCDGDGVCCKCRMQVTEGLAGLAAPNDKELFLQEKFVLKNNERVACQISVTTDIEVKTTYW